MVFGLKSSGVGYGKFLGGQVSQRTLFVKFGREVKQPRITEEFVI
jgi:hypothetical protein